MLSVIYQLYHYTTHHCYYAITVNATKLSCGLVNATSLNNEHRAAHSNVSVFPRLLLVLTPLGQGYSVTGGRQAKISPCYLPRLTGEGGGNRASYENIVSYDIPDISFQQSDLFQSEKKLDCCCHMPCHPQPPSNARFNCQITS